MIINGGSRSNWRFFAHHLTKTEENEHVHVAEIKGLAADTVLEAFRELDALGGCTRVKNTFYHANINPRDDEYLTPEQWEKAIDLLERNLGLEGNPRIVIEHEKFGRVHRHVIWSRIDAETLKAIPDSNNYACHMRTAVELEKEFGLTPASRERGPDGRNPEAWETFRGARSGIDPKEVKAEVTELWRQADNGHAFAAALASKGYILARGDRRDFVLVDRHGDTHSLARRISGVKAAEIRDRLAGLDRAALPSAKEASALARKARDEKPTPPEVKALEPKPERRDRFRELVQDAMRAAKEQPKAARTREPMFTRLSGAMKKAFSTTLAPRPSSHSPYGFDRLTRALKARNAHTSPAPAAPKAASAFQRLASALKRAAREATGPDGFTPWERASARLAAVPQLAARWLADRVQPARPLTFAARLDHEGGDTRQPDTEKER